MLNIEWFDSLKLDEGHVFLQFVVRSWEHQRRHDFQVVELGAVVNDDVEVVGIDGQLQTRTCRVRLQLFVDVPAHQAYLSRHSERVRRGGHNVGVVGGGATRAANIIRGTLDGRDERQLLFEPCDLLLW